ncbi:hypothetical protein LIER_01785 [Lithospermum erythrorhizon]|uniref:Interactor of constitutive active ROPs 3-like n=1 Tax=Lithospermum erythrorhizon TaxID=34254 RepID=A0AAV3NPM9_LITER
MQTPKARTSSSEVPRKLSPRASSLEGPKKTSPRTVSSEGQPKISPRVVRQLKTTVQDPETATPSNRTCRTPKDKSPKVSESRAQRSPVGEKKRPSRIPELESQISQLEGDLEKVKDQLVSSESWRKQAQEDAEASKQQLLAITAKLKQYQKHLSEPSASGETETVEIHQSASENQDENLVFDVEVIKEQHSVDSVNLTTEIEKLKYQLEMVAESEASQTKHAVQAQSELHTLKQNLAETLALMGDIKDQLRDCKESEAHAKSIVSETLLQLETAKRTVETVRSEGMKSIEAYDAIASELQQSRAHVNALEDLVNKYKAFEVNGVTSNYQTSANQAEDLGIDKGGKSGGVTEKSPEGTRGELDSVKSEVGHLRSALEAAEIRLSEEQNQRVEEMRSANELMEQLKFASNQRENELETELKKSRMEIEHLKANLMDKETEVQGICEENEFLNSRLKSVLSGQGEQDLEKLLEKSRAEIENLKAGLMDKETELQNISEENEMLKLGTNKKEVNLGKTDKDIEAKVEAARAAEKEALVKVGYMKEEVDKSNRKSICVAEQLDAAQAANAELEVQLRRLKVQADQWRKAAEAAAAMLSSGNNGKYVERTSSMDSPYTPRSGKVGSPYSEDVEEDLLKRKNPNVLKKIGVLWKKPQK